MADTNAQEHDQSMEEILQSIKRIIAEENDDPVAPSPSAASDVLELTDIVREDGSVVSAKQEETVPAPSTADTVPVADMAKLAEEPLPQTSPLSLDHFMSATEPVKITPKKESPEVAAELLTTDTLAASVASMQNLSRRAPEPQGASPETREFRSGLTVEDLVIEALKPMLSDWLNAHLPRIVERLVDREIRRISQ